MFINFSLSHAGSFKGMCKQIDHFPEDADYEADASEYFLRESSSTFKSNAEVSFCVPATHTRPRQLRTGDNKHDKNGKGG